MKTAVNGFRSSKFSTLIRSRVAESNGVVRIAVKHSKTAVFAHAHYNIINMAKKNNETLSNRQNFATIIGNQCR